jgi:hypothetical protein
MLLRGSRSLFTPILYPAAFFWILSMAHLLKHPTESVLVNLDKFSIIKPCSINPTHVDFYINPVKDGERGQPDYTIIFNTELQRDAWFKGKLK